MNTLIKYTTKLPSGATFTMCAPSAPEAETPVEVYKHNHKFGHRQAMSQKLTASVNWASGNRATLTGGSR
jgi:hypothetical protein